MYFAGVVTGSLIFPRMGDIYGRKNIAVMGNIGHLATGLSILLSTDISMTVGMNFGMGLSMAARQFVGYAWMAECLCASDMPLATVVMFCFDGLSLGVASLFFRYVSNNWHVIYGIPLICCVFQIFFQAI